MHRHVLSQHALVYCLALQLQFCAKSHNITWREPWCCLMSCCKATTHDQARLAHEHCRLMADDALAAYILQYILSWCVQLKPQSGPKSSARAQVKEVRWTYSRYAVHCKDNITQLHDSQHQQQRRRYSLAILNGEERITIVVVSNRYQFPAQSIMHQSNWTMMLALGSKTQCVLAKQIHSSVKTGNAPKRSWHHL